MLSGSKSTTDASRMLWRHTQKTNFVCDVNFRPSDCRTATSPLSQCANQFLGSFVVHRSWFPSLLEIFHLPNLRKSAADSTLNPIVSRSWRWGRYTTKRQPSSRVETLAHFLISASSTLHPEAGRCVLF
ncbi:hypothetical protein HBI56_168910 [Parastagonospora nodorum]|nr:hypothetical protein HBH53_184340 [Parastagonospora nodorum]KAH4196058.1 hypothetical protein HBH42_081020 [Parastagonospora nodorum]KAH4252813.1 hypothetical protein HBI03_204650 [Parastagonospora nodorum]KAH4276661.1 hypothetical protein HBI04_111760 [Parastagonospora nodorum]KAH4805231.1 hypothetical protein HBH61_163090 [Parastagonospora nodorum]